MASIIESIASSFGPDIIGKLAPALGADSSAVSKGLGAIGPLLLNGMSSLAGTPAGAEGLLKALPQGGGGLLPSLLGSVMGGASALGGGGGILSSLLGPGINAVGSSISRAVGFNVAPLLSLVAPAALGAVAKMVKDKGLNAGNIGPALAQERSAYFDNPAHAEQVSLVRAAVSAGDKAATMIHGYGAEWSRVQAAPAAALMMVATSDLSGPVGSMKEVQAATKTLAAAAHKTEPTSLLAAAFGSGIDTDMLKQVRDLAPTKDKLLDIVKAGAASVASKSPAEAAAYKATILAVAKAAAEASKEGGFLGIGGTLVSKDEQAALDRLSAALA
jgi:Bacterial protein of unknown function (DUF937)